MRWSLILGIFKKYLSYNSWILEIDVFAGQPSFSKNIRMGIIVAILVLKQWIHFCIMNSISIFQTNWNKLKWLKDGNNTRISNVETYRIIPRRPCKSVKPQTNPVMSAMTCRIQYTTSKNSSWSKSWWPFILRQIQK